MNYEDFAIYSKIVDDFGSYDLWKEDFIATGKSSLGWAILLFDNFTQKLMNVSVDFHNNGAIWDSELVCVVMYLNTHITKIMVLIEQVILRNLLRI